MDPISRAQSTSVAVNEPGQRVIGRPWPKGVSGNPGGKPKKLVVTNIFEEILQDPNMRELVKQQIVSTVTSRGMAGVLLLREMAERTEGKVTQGIELSGSVSTMTESEVDERLTKLLDLDLKRQEVIDVTPANEPLPDTLTTK